MIPNTIPHIVIADDDLDLVHALTIRCSALGLQVHAAYDAMSAWELIESLHPDIVLLDAEMPAGSGLGISALMAQHDELNQTPVILLTGRTDKYTIRRCHELMVYYVEKCDDTWARLKPLLCEILEKQGVSLNQDKGLPTTQSGENRAMMRLMDAVFAAMGSEDSPEQLAELSEPIPESLWVLCIDDDEAFANGLRLRLKKQGVELIQASEGMEGYRRAFTSPADLILLDYEMPNGNGEYVLRRLKENPVTCNIPVIVLTGRHEKLLEHTMYAMGAAGFMTKPYDWPMLWEEIRRHLPEPANMPG